MEKEEWDWLRATFCQTCDERERERERVDKVYFF